MTNLYYILDTEENKHIVSGAWLSMAEVKDGCVVLDDEHNCSECDEYIKGKRNW